MTKSDSESKKRAFEQPDPITYMRGRHPDLYSDSSTTMSVELSQGLLEYHLDTLTARNQENEFAYFARRLAEKEICPNLRSQTGPMGGGDSKADSETIPVSSAISELWVGADPKAATERWAFAFSAAKKWKAKVAHDVRSIASTDRGYKRIYFISNQFARDKSRAQSEDNLTKEVGIPVTILDRSWITKAVFEHDRIDLAVEALKIDELRQRVEKKIGPADRERQEELDKLERAIADPDRYGAARHQLIEDALRAAILARGLGRPRTEIDGLFMRADRLASDPESPKKRLRIAYNYAWSLIFWFDDFRQLNFLYDTVEGFALKSDQVEEVELAQNLWMVLLSQVRRGALSKEDAKIDVRKAALIGVFERLSKDGTRPNNALQAKTSLTVISIQDAVEAGDKTALDDVWEKLNQIVHDAASLGDYPFERLAKLIEELSTMGAGGEEFEKLFENILSQLEALRGGGSSATLLLNRGQQKIEANKPYEAITFLGRALDRFRGREYRDEIIQCHLMLASAYSDVGLLWAARSSALAATERCFAYFREEGKIIRIALLAAKTLTLVELRLGRIAHFLTAYELESMIAPQIALTDDLKKNYAEHHQLIEGLLCISMLSTSLPQLAQMQKLPDALEQLGLFMPKGCLLYALGYRDELRNEGMPRETWSDENIDKFMALAFSQPGRLQMPFQPQIEANGKVRYVTRILGCEVLVEAPATRKSIYLAEAVLSTLEAFFATSLHEKVMPFRGNAKIILEPAELTSGLSITEENIEGDVFLRIRYPSSTLISTIGNRSAYKDGLRDVIAHFISHVAVIPDLRRYIDHIGMEERGFARALFYSETCIPHENLFGLSPKMLVSDWNGAEGSREFPLIRSVIWHDGVAITQMPLPKETEGMGPPKGVADDKPFDLSGNRSKHSDRTIVSQIDVPLWNQAGWRGVFYTNDPRLAPIPVFCLAFADQEAASKIFKGWRNQLGAVDQKNVLRITIIKGVKRLHPSAYRVLVTTNFDPREKPESLIYFVARHHTLTPKSTEMRDGFLESVTKAGRYLLAPAVFVSETETPILGTGLGIEKTELVVKNAWEIGRTDPDASAFFGGDDPFIPPDIENAPVLEFLETLREIENRQKAANS